MMNGMFFGALKFNQDINYNPITGAWDVRKVIEMISMFDGDLSFNGNISNWFPRDCRRFDYMFRGCTAFNQNLSSWQINVQRTVGMFQNASSFNQDLSGWNMYHCIYTQSMFHGASSFTSDLSKWDFQHLLYMGSMFYNATSFNSNISNWKMNKVSDMTNVFNGATSFNSDIGNWDVANATNMANMFNGATSFNSDIGNWNVKKVSDMTNMFNGATNFSQDLSLWEVPNILSLPASFYPTATDPRFLPNWGFYRLNLNGNRYNTFLQWVPYTELGISDSYSPVTITSDVNISLPGSYKVTYSVANTVTLLTSSTGKKPPSVAFRYVDILISNQQQPAMYFSQSVYSFVYDPNSLSFGVFDLSGLVTGGLDNAMLSFSGTGVSGNILTYTDVSSYTVYASKSYADYNDVSASTIITITNATQPSFDFSSSFYSVQYNPSSKTVDLSGRTIGGLPEATLTFSGTGVSGTTLTYTDDVSTYTVIATKTYANYNDVSASTIITITNATQPTFDFASPSYSVQYNPSSKTVDLSGRTTGGLPEATITFSGTGVSGNILTYTDVSSYTVYATKTFANYDDVSASSIITITNATQPTFGFSSSTYFVKYDPLTMTVDLSGKTIGGLPEAALSFSGTGVSGSILTYTGTGNYTVNATKMYANYNNVSASSTIIITGLSVFEQRKATKTMVSNLSVTQSPSARLIIPKAEILGFDFKQKTTVLVVQPSTTITKMDMRDHAVYSLLENTGDQITFPSRTSEVTVKNIGNDQFELKNAGTTFATLTSGENTVFDHLTLSVGSVMAELDPLIILCFKRDTKILCLCQKTCKEIYMKIQELTPGTLVKTFKHGFVPISTIGYRNLHNSGDSVRTRNRLYECSVKDYPELFENLVITGCHSILEDIVSHALQKELETENGGQLYTTDGKCRVMAFMDKRTKPFPKKGAFEIWHFSLEHDDEYKNYGVYANGLLVETASKRMMKDYSDMTMISAK
jgi:surface protein